MRGSRCKAQVTSASTQPGAGAPLTRRLTEGLVRESPGRLPVNCSSPWEASVYVVFTLLLAPLKQFDSWGHRLFFLNIHNIPSTLKGWKTHLKELRGEKQTNVSTQGIITLRRVAQLRYHNSDDGEDKNDLSPCPLTAGLWVRWAKRGAGRLLRDADKHLSLGWAPEHLCYQVQQGQREWSTGQDLIRLTGNHYCYFTA